MSNINDFLKQLSIDLQQTNSHYVYYENESGSINKISSTDTPSDRFEILKVNSSQVIDLLNGYKKVSDFRVVFDIAQKKLVLRELASAANQSVVNPLVRIPKVDKSNVNADFNIVQHDTEWEVFLSEETRLFLKTHLEDKSFVHLSVTELNEPHILFETLKVNISDLIHNEKTLIPIGFKMSEPVSIYTTKYFDSYAHGV